MNGGYREHWSDYPVVNQMVRLATVLSPLAFLLVLSGWSGSASPALEGPQGCEDVFAATTRGNASLSPRGFACALFAPSGTIQTQWVVDGDTLVLSNNQHVRYTGIDAPEMSGFPEFYAVEATRANRRLVEGRWVRLEEDVSDRDRFDRLLRYVYVTDVMVNAELIREGFARAAAFPPDTRYAACFAALEEEARKEGRGLWAEAAVPTP